MEILIGILLTDLKLKTKITIIQIIITRKTQEKIKENITVLILIKVQI